MNCKIKSISDNLEQSIYGTKAYWLSWLYRNGYEVPHALCLPAVESFDGLHQFDISQESLHDLLAPTLADQLFDVAVRSSATCEDTQNSSLAGHFQTVIGRMTVEEVVSNIRRVIESLTVVKFPHTCKMGVIIQKRIASKFSGVAFSSNPISGEINQSVISVIPGMGMALVSGHAKGEDVLIVSSNGEPIIPSHVTPIPRDKMREIWHTVKDIEQKLAHPVDVEWCIDEDSEHLFILQCRPATGIMRGENLVVPVSTENISRIPATVLSNKKVSIRLQAEKLGVHISRAYLVCLNRTEASIQVPFLGLIEPSPFCIGYSIVLIHPQTVTGKVIRTFSRHEALRNNLEKIGTIARVTHWMSVAIVQEIFDPIYTGMAKRIENGYVVEIALGHFVPKGMVATSQYITDNEGLVNYAKEAKQDHCLRILDGEVIETEVSLEHSLVSMPRNQIKKVVMSLSPFLDSEHVSVEFGVIEITGDNGVYSYLIDSIEEKENPLIDSQMILEGVLSKGRITGRTVSYKPDPTRAKLDIHFHDELSADISNDNPKIFLCESPDISLIEIIQTHDPRNLGFIFREASVLCHLAIILREKGIPAIQTETYDELSPEQTITIDALSAGLRGKERIVRHD